MDTATTNRTDMSSGRSTHPGLEHAPANHPAVRYGRIGVLLVNLGTPDATDYWSMRRYLNEFLSDRRVIEVNPLIWQPILNLVILTRRPQKSGKAYQSVWNKELDESPLRTFTRAQGDKLGQRLATLGPKVQVDWAMRYGNPSIESRLQVLQSAGCERILVFPLYPQYAAATTATVNDKTFQALAKMRWQPALRTVPPYHDDPIYIDALATSIRTHLAGLTWQPEVVLASYHGIPKSYFDKGDPYHCHCMKTTRLLHEALGWDKGLLRPTLSVAFRPAGMAAALHRQNRRGAGQIGCQAHRGGHARICLRLPRDHRGNRGRECRDLQSQWRRTVHSHPVPQRQRAGYARSGSRGSPRADGLDLTFCPCATGCPRPARWMGK